MTPTIVNGVPLMSTAWPIAAGALPKRSRESRSAIATTGTAARPSSSRKPRPATGVTPSTSKKLSETISVQMRSAPAGPESDAGCRLCTRRPSSEAEADRRSTKSGYDIAVYEKLFDSKPTSTMRLASTPGSGLSSTALIQLKIVVLAPMPSASVRIATAVKPGACRARRTANRTSCSTPANRRARRLPVAAASCARSSIRSRRVPASRASSTCRASAGQSVMCPFAAATASPSESPRPIASR